MATLCSEAFWLPGPVIHQINKWRKGNSPSPFSLTYYEGHAFSLDSFIKVIQWKEGSKPAFFFPSLGKWSVFQSWWRGAAFSRVYFPLLSPGIWFGCFVSFITHRLLPKKNRVCARREAKAASHSFSQTHTHTRSHTEQHGGCFSGALYGLRRWKRIIKVQSRSSGTYWKDFFGSFVNPWLNGLHIRLEGLSSVSLLSLPPESSAVLALSAFAHFCQQCVVLQLMQWRTGVTRLLCRDFSVRYVTC